jgi:hypothetical protein
MVRLARSIGGTRLNLFHPYIQPLQESHWLLSIPRHPFQDPVANNDSLLRYRNPLAKSIVIFDSILKNKLRFEYPFSFSPRRKHFGIAFSQLLNDEKNYRGEPLLEITPSIATCFFCLCFRFIFSGRGRIGNGSFCSGRRRRKFPIPCRIVEKTRSR